MKNSPTSIAAEAYRRAIEITRADLFGPAPDRQLPLHLQDDAAVPFLGFAGPNYQAGGVLLLAINPGGGTESNRTRPVQDQELIPYIQAFKVSTPPEIGHRFAEMSSNYLKQAMTWNLWGILQPVLKACGKRPDEIAFANICPFRTHKDHKPHVGPLKNAIDQVTKPLVSGLRAGTIVVLGKKAGDALEGHAVTTGAYFVVPRTNGDSYVSAEAAAVLKVITRNAA